MIFHIRICNHDNKPENPFLSYDLAKQISYFMKENVGNWTISGKTGCQTNFGGAGNYSTKFENSIIGMIIKKTALMNRRRTPE